SRLRQSLLEDEFAIRVQDVHRRDVQLGAVGGLPHLLADEKGGRLAFLESDRPHPGRRTHRGRPGELASLRPGGLLPVRGEEERIFGVAENREMDEGKSYDEPVVPDALTRSAIDEEGVT